MNSALSDAPRVGSTINPVLGALLCAGKEDLDFVLEGTLPLRWQRTYRSTNPHVGWFGRGWGSPLEVRLQAVPDADRKYVDHVVYIDPFGRHIEFPYLLPGRRFFSPSERLTLSRTERGEYRVETSDGVTYSFTEHPNNAFRVSQVSDRNGNTIRLHFRETKEGIAGVYIWCSGGQRVELFFDNSRLKQIVEQRHAQTRDASVTLVRYEYTAEGDLSRVLNRCGECVRSFEYDSARRMRKHVYAGMFEASFEYEGAGTDSKVNRHWDNVGRHWIFEYNVDHTAVTDIVGHITKYHFDPERRCIGVTDPKGQVTRRCLDRYGNVRAFIDPLEHTTEIAFDERSNPIEIRDASGAVTKIEWHSTFALPVAVSDALNRATRYEYDARGNLIHRVDPTGAQTSYVRDDRGLVISVEDAKGGKNQQRRNERGQLTHFTDCSGKTTNLSYDADGRLTSISNALGECTTYSYDPLGRLVRHSLPDGSTETYEYDLAGRVLTVTNGEKETTRCRYTPDGLLEERIDALGGALRYRYNTARKLVELTNQNGARYTFEYDGVDQLVQETRFDGTCTKYEYDSAGNLAATTEAPSGPDAIITRYIRDEVGRLLRRASARNWAVYEYDAAGQIVEGRNAETRVILRYDDAGRVIEEIAASSDYRSSIKYTYDALGNRIETELDGGDRLSWVHYGSGYAHQLRFNDHAITDIERDDLHREISRTQGILTTHRCYDPVGRLQRQWTSANDSAVDAHRQVDIGVHIERRYQYDLCGRLVAALDCGRSLFYGYDALGRLTSFNEERFAFDPAHNLIGAGPEVPAQPRRIEDDRVKVYEDKRYRYDSHGRVIEKRIGSRVVLSFEWDDDHRMVAATRQDNSGSSTTQYVYDAFGRRLVKRGPAWCTWFVWEGNRLIRECSEREARVFVYEPGSFVPLAQLTATNEGPTVNKAPAANARGGHQTFYYHCDQVGQPRELTDVSGSVVWEAEYKGWGGVAARRAATACSHAEQLNQPLRYQGQYFDEETGLHYNRYRYYDPDVGRFLTPDPIGLQGGENLYQYAVNSTTWIDPLGLAKFTPAKKRRIIAENEAFFGVATCEKCKCALVRPKRSESGVTPPTNEWQTDHIDPESLGGAATEINGQLLCRTCNREDWDKPKPNYKDQNRAAAAAEEEECE